MKFTHLHVHTEYSLLDGASPIKNLIARVKELGMDSIAITDHGVMYGVVDFYKEALANNVKPIIGCEVYMSKNSLFEREGSRDREASHLVLLCKNNTGYQNLIKLVSIGFTQGFYYKPRIDYDTLEKYSEGLVCLSACLAGDIPRLLEAGQYESAKKLALRLNNMFGQGNFYLELQDHGILEQKQINKLLVNLADEINIPLVATNDCHYIAREDASAHDVLLCVQTQAQVDDSARMRFEGEEFYVKSPDEMEELFSWRKDAIENTQIIADMCNMEFDFNTRHLPNFDVPAKFGTDHFQYLYNLCLNGLKAKYNDITEELTQRLDYELGVISSMGFTDYFLIVWDFVRYAHEREIEVGCRGSGAGSLVSYCLGITEVDPIKYQLYFERFLNPERVSMPDFDIDFDDERRHEVIEYVNEKYGHDHVVQIITFGTMAARAVIRDVGRALGMGYGEVDRIAKMIPSELKITIDKALETNSDLKAVYDTDESVKQLIDYSKKLEGLPRHASTHAAGVVITKEPATNYVPLNRNGDIITTQFTMGTIEELGLLKMDFLGLRTLSVIQNTCQLAKESKGADIDVHTLEVDNKNVYELISKADTDGVFQLESAGMRNFLSRLKPDNFEEVVAAISLYRPGPMDYIPQYIAGKKNPDSVKYDHPILEKSLDVTYGCMVYQEQVMQIVRDVAGYSLGRSDLVRRAMSKKKHKVMEEEREYFIHGKVENGQVVIPGAIRNGVDEKSAMVIYERMMKFANYAFNKPHAACYALVAYRTAWLKIHYPVEFMAATMNSYLGSSTKIANYIRYCKKHDIDVLPPNVNSSGARFKVEGDNIRFGLAAIKNVGYAAVEQIQDERISGGRFVDFFDFCDRCSHFINKKMIESLIYAGAFDELGAYRSQLLFMSEGYIESVQKARRHNHKDQISIFEIVGGKEIPKPELPNLNEMDNREKLRKEKEMTGIYITGHPLSEYEDIISKYTINSTMFEKDSDDKLFDGEEAEIAGIVESRQIKYTKKNEMMCFATIEDLYGSVEIIVFPRQMRTSGDFIQKDNVVSVRGKVNNKEGEDAKIIADRILPLAMKAEKKKIYLKIDENGGQDAINVIKKIAEINRGDIPVYIFDSVKNKKYLLDSALWIMCDDVQIFKFKNLLGEDNVVIHEE